MDLKNIEQIILIVSMIILGIFAICSLIISIKGPRFTDRLVAVSVINTEVNIMICLLAVTFSKGYILDIALVYGLIGFVAIVVLAKLFLQSYLEKHNTTAEEQMKEVRNNDGRN